jgi:hypothetical protein
MSIFRVTGNKGFQMKFENGWTISVQFGYGNYCDNYQHPDGFDFAKGLNVVQSSDAEIAIWSGDTWGSDWYTFENGDTVLGHQAPDQVAQWISKVAAFDKK